MKKIYLIAILFIMICTPFGYCGSNYTYKTYSSSKHLYKEKDYQHAWCKIHNGIEEYQNKDYTRVDCLTTTNAVEFDFAKKWAESVGQALHYQYMTGKRGKVVLILEDVKTQMVYYKRVQKLGELYNFDTEYVTPNILNQANSVAR